MWMQQSMEGAGFGNSHERNRFGNGQGSRFDSGGSSYMGGGGRASAANGDWKSKILESGQWLGGKVIEYGGKLARGGSHDSIPDHMMNQPRNDGRANWMADIRNSSSSSSSYNNGGGYSGGGSTYQNDFVTERPKAYTDTGYSQSSSSQSYSSKPPQAPFRDRTNSDKDSRRVKKKSADPKHAKKGKKKHSKRREVSESEDSDSSSVSEASASESSSGSDSDDKHRRSKAKNKGKKHQKRRESFSSSEEETLEAKPKSKKTPNKPEKAPADYSFSFDPAKLPSPPVEESSSKKAKKDKKTSKSRGRRQSMESSESELSDKENQRTKKVTLKSKSATKKSASQATVDLLGVDLDATPVYPVAVSSAMAPQPDIFAQTVDPLQDLAGLNFTTSYAQPQALAPVAFGIHPPAQPTHSTLQAPANQAADTQALKNLLPENSIIDLDSLASDRKKLNGSAVEKKTLAELHREKLSEQPQQQQQAMLMQQQPQMMMGMQTPMGQAMLMQQQQQQQQQVMQMQMQMGHVGPMNHMHAMMPQMQFNGQPSQQGIYVPQIQGFQQVPHQKNNGMDHFPYAQQ